MHNSCRFSTEFFSSAHITPPFGDRRALEAFGAEVEREGVDGLGPEGVNGLVLGMAPLGWTPEMGKARRRSIRGVMWVVW